MEEQTTRSRGPSLPPIVRHIAGAVFLLTLAGWTGQGLLCYHRLWAWCAGEHYVTVAGLVALIVLTPIGLSYKQRASRRASKGMWARGWNRGDGRHDLAATFSRVVKFAIDGEWPREQESPGLITGTQRFRKLGWWITIPLDGGRVVWVDRWRLWQWLIEVEGLRYQMESGESEIGERYWEPRIGRPLWMAYMIILESTGAAETLTPDPRSRRYVGSGDAWGWVEEYERWRIGQGLPANEVR